MMNALQTPPPSSAKTAAPTAEDANIQALLTAASSEDTDPHGSTASPAFVSQLAGSMDESDDDARPASVALDEREGYEMADAFVRANALDLPSDQYLASFRRAFDAANATTLRVTDKGELGLLVLEVYLRNLEQGSMDLPRDLAYQCLQARLSERRDVIRYAELRKMRKELHQAKRGVARSGTVVTVGDSRLGELSAVTKALEAVPRYTGARKLTLHELSQRKARIEAAFQGHEQVSKDPNAMLNATDARLAETAYNWSQSWRSKEGTGATFEAHWEAFKIRFGKTNSHMEHLMQLSTMTPFDKGVDRSAGSYAEHVLEVITREERQEKGRFKHPDKHPGFSDMYKLSLFLHAMRSVPKLFKKLMDKQLSTLSAAVQVCKTELKKPEYLDKNDKFKLDVIAYVCTECCGLHPTEDCKIKGKGKRTVAEKQLRRPNYHAMAIAAVQAFNLPAEDDHEAGIEACVAAFQAEHNHKRKYTEGQGGRGRGDGRGGRRARGHRGGGGYRGRGRGYGESRGRGRGRGGRSYPEHAAPTLSTGELAALYKARAAAEEKKSSAQKEE